MDSLSLDTNLLTYYCNPHKFESQHCNKYYCSYTIEDMIDQILIYTLYICSTKITDIRYIVESCRINVKFQTKVFVFFVATCLTLANQSSLKMHDPHFSYTFVICNLYLSINNKHHNLPCRNHNS